MNPNQLSDQFKKWLATPIKPCGTTLIYAWTAWQAALEDKFDGWAPSPANVNALPEPLKKYVHDLETRCDPAGMVAENTLLHDQSAMLQAMLTRRQASLDILKQVPVAWAAAIEPLSWGALTQEQRKASLEKPKEWRQSQQEIIDVGTWVDQKEAELHAKTLVSLSSPPKEKRAPVQGLTGGIPWALHLEAYDAYCTKYGAQPALIDLEGKNCRGGFGVEELDMFIPGWRDKVSEITKLKARIAELELQWASRPTPSVRLTAFQLQEVLSFLAPDRDSDPEQWEGEVTLGIVRHKDDDGTDLGKALCCWTDDSDGVFPLDTEWKGQWLPATKERVPLAVAAILTIWHACAHACSDGNAVKFARLIEQHHSKD